MYSRFRGTFVIFFALSWFFAVPEWLRGDEPRPQTLRIGVSRLLFPGVSDALMLAVMRPMSGLMKDQTGLPSEWVIAGDGDEIATDLQAGRLQLGVVEGVHLGWARQQHADLQPLLLAVNRTAYARAVVVVRHNDAVQRFTDLKGRKLSVCAQTRLCSKLFLQRLCRESDQDTLAAFFGGIRTQDNVEDMLDDLIDGQVDVALVEEICLDGFMRRKPGRGQRVRVLVTSEKFPCPAMIFRRGRLERNLLQRLHAGMAAADKTPRGRNLFALFQMSGFIAVPDDYEAQLIEIGKRYPPRRLPAVTVPTLP